MSNEITEKQKKFIEEMQEFSDIPLPLFNGNTEQEASNYINKYWKTAHENLWAIENGY